MNLINRYKLKIIATTIIAIMLIISFYLPERKSEPVSEKTNTFVSVETKGAGIEGSVETATFVEKKEIILPTPTIETTQEVKETPAPMPPPVAPLETTEPTETTVENNTFSCTLTVRCDTILDNIEKLAPEKMHLVPENGIILLESELEFSEGNTVFDVLEKELKKCNIHFEFSKVAMSDSVYIEGIGNLYEFDCGNLSGWLYRVNGIVPSVGCSQYKMKNGDKIEWVYTCNLGKDVH